MSDGPDPFEHDDAAYVLGALSRERRIAYETHLQTCARCSAAVAQLAVLPGLLGRLPALPAPAAPPPEPPDTVLPGILATIRRHRSRRRVWGAAAGVAAAAVLVTGTVVVTEQAQPAPGGTGVTVALTSVTDAPVQADLRLQGVAWGTKITMTCRYDGSVAAEPYGSATTYHLVVVSAADHTTQHVASWQVLPDRDATVAGSTDLSPDQIAEVQLQDEDGDVLLEGSPSR